MKKYLGLLIFLLLPSMSWALPPLHLGTVGTVTSVTGSLCKNGAVSGASCFKVPILCDDANFDEAVDDPPVGPSAIIAVKQAATPVGIVVFFGAHPEVHYFGGFKPGKFAKDLSTAGYTTVQVKWAAGMGGYTDPGQNSTGGQHGQMMWFGCRNATLIDYIWQTYVKNRAYPMCSMSASEGTGAPLTVLHFAAGPGAPGPRLDSEVKFVTAIAGPSQGDFDRACTASPSATIAVGTNGTQNATWPCSSSTVSGYAGLARLINSWNVTTTCQNSPSSGDRRVWQEASIDYPGNAQFAPLTKFASWQCYQSSDRVSGMGQFAWNKISSADIVDSACVPRSGTRECTAAGGANCCPAQVSQEFPYTSNGTTQNANYSAILNEFEANCR